jgi:hypothetical protein
MADKRVELSCAKQAASLAQTGAGGRSGLNRSNMHMRRMLRVPIILLAAAVCGLAVEVAILLCCLS